MSSKRAAMRNSTALDLLATAASASTPFNVSASAPSYTPRTPAASPARNVEDYKSLDEDHTECASTTHAAGGVETLLDDDFGMAYDQEPNAEDHKKCTHGPITAENGYEFFCEIPRGCPHQTQKVMDDSRKCVSNFFGRNKAEAIAIKRPITWCRSHYQTNAYQVERWQLTKLRLIWEQFQRIQEDTPNTKFCVILKKEESERLEHWIKARCDQPRKALRVVKDTRGKGYRSPLWALVHVQRHFLRRNKTMEQCKVFLDWVLESFRVTAHDSKKLRRIPQIEFLAQIEGIHKFSKLRGAQRDGVLRGEKGSPEFAEFDAWLKEHGDEKDDEPMPDEEAQDNGNEPDLTFTGFKRPADDDIDGGSEDSSLPKRARLQSTPHSTTSKAINRLQPAISPQSRAHSTSLGRVDRIQSQHQNPSRVDKRNAQLENEIAERSKQINAAIRYAQEMISSLKAAKLNSPAGAVALSAADTALTAIHGLSPVTPSSSSLTLPGSGLNHAATRFVTPIQSNTASFDSTRISSSVITPFSRKMVPLSQEEFSPSPQLVALRASPLTPARSIYGRSLSPTGSTIAIPSDSDTG